MSALDVLRALVKEPDGLPAFMAECELAAGGDARLDAHLDAVRERTARLFDPTDATPVEQRMSAAQFTARALVEDLAVALQASLLVRHAPAAVADAFCAGRLGGGGRVYGTLPAGVDARTVVDRALPA